MNRLPVLFLAFANNSSRPLPGLEAEGEALYRVLSGSVGQLFFYVHREPFATVEKLSHYLLEYRNRVVIFHYGGHAGQQSLLLEDGEAPGAGIAALLAQQQNLKLVFLNGCSTVQQVAGLLKLGIPAVIATYAPVDDERTKDMSVQFYKALAQGQTLHEAFSFASAYWQTRTGQPLHFERSIGFAEAHDEQPVWGLYASKDADLNWKLPQSASRQKRLWNYGKWLALIVIGIGVLVGIAELSGFHIQDLWSKPQPAPVEQPAAELPRTDTLPAAPKPPASGPEKTAPAKNNVKIEVKDKAKVGNIITGDSNKIEVKQDFGQ
ncbi:MAG TPA: CHAT domain-containing protein [Saprospiraceae bacterium]|nr:CHAT domain-containing protein [Saprospiraceae bacterium]